tara:strand:- start:470 stop:1612 length:1143 start_codon:yes stop_codon:yes gene_type:complete
MNIGDDVLRLVLMFIPWNETTIKYVSRRFRVIIASPEYRAARKMYKCEGSGVLLLSPVESLSNWDYTWVLETEGNRRLYTRRRPPREIADGACHIIHKNNLMVIGGSDWESCPPTITNRVDIFCPVTITWISEGMLKECRRDCVGCTVGHDVIVAGGRNPAKAELNLSVSLTTVEILLKRYGSLTTVEILRSSTDQWDYISDLLYPAVYSAACVLNGRLYIAGGILSNKLQMWDGTAWYYKANLPNNISQLYSAACIAIDGRMWLIGGLITPDERTSFPEVSKSVLIYDHKTDRWEDGPALPKPRHKCNAVMFNGNLIVFGDPIFPGKSFLSRDEYEPLVLIDGRWSNLSMSPSLDLDGKLSDFLKNKTFICATDTVVLS